MCGIAGAWSNHNALDERDFAVALKLLEHRGPDEQQFLSTSNINIGTQRLKIIGLDHGSQPKHNNKGQYLVFNGAIYNYPEIGKSINFQSNSDTDILFELVTKRGFENSISTLNGMFSIAYYDEHLDTFLLARDRMGQKPLYYYHNQNTFLFASEIKSLKKLMQLKNIPIQLNKNAIFHYLCYSNIPEPETIYENIYALPPASILKFNKGNLSIESFWKHNYQKNESISFQDAKELIKVQIEDAVKIRLRADVKKGLFLSGGWDSSVIAMEAAKFDNQLAAYTVKYPFQTDQNESDIAKTTAKQFGLNHEIISIDKTPIALLNTAIKTFDQPLADSSALPNLAIAEIASKKVKVMLNGDGGDELFGGYRRYFTAKNIKFLSALKYFSFFDSNNNRKSKFGFLNRINRITQSKFPEKYLLYTTDMFRDIDKDQILNNAKSFQSAEQLLWPFLDDKLSELDQLMHLDRNFNLLSGILVKMDRASMAYSVEARSPFLDYRLFETMNTLDEGYKIKGFSRKHLLKSIYKDQLPKEVTKSKKISFEAPLEEWIKNDFNEIIQDLLYDPNANIYQFINYNEISGLFRKNKYQDRNTYYILYSLLILELWLIENN